MNITPVLLHSLGLTPAEARVYLAALELGEANMQELASKSGVKRTTIYSFLDRLKERQLLIETRKRKRNVYSAAHPAQLVGMSKTRLFELERMLPHLLAIHNASPHKPRVTFYEGIDGIKEVYEDSLKEGKHIVAWSDFDHMWQVLGPDYFFYYPHERARRGMTFRSILPDSPLTRKITRNNKEVLRETKFITSGEMKTEINIYGDKVALMSFRSSPAFAVLIQDHDIAETLRTVWKEMWERLPAAA